MGLVKALKVIPGAEVAVEVVESLFVAAGVEM